MRIYKLSFAEIHLLREDIAEVIVNDGVEMDLQMVEEYHALLLNIMTYPFSILINKLNSYTYTFEAQQHLAMLSQINAMAVVVYNKVSETTTKNLISMPREMTWEIKIFNERQMALSWLLDKQQ